MPFKRVLNLTVLIAIALGLSASSAHAFEANAIKLSSLIKSPNPVTLIKSAYALIEYQKLSKIYPPSCAAIERDYACRPYTTLENKKVYVKLNGSIDESQSSSIIKLKGNNLEEGLKSIVIRMKYSDLITEEKHNLHCSISAKDFQTKQSLPVSSFSLNRSQKNYSNKQSFSFYNPKPLLYRKLEIKASQPYIISRNRTINPDEIRNLRVRLGFKI